jgi:UrcA family protein
VSAARADEVSATTATKSVLVTYEAAALGRDEGARALHERLEAAARRVCGVPDLKNLRERRQWQECYEAALTDAAARIGDPRVAALAE